MRLVILHLTRTSKEYLLDNKFSFKSTGNDRYSGHGYSGIHRYSGTKTPDDAILFTVSGITAIVEQKFRKFRVFSENLSKLPKQSRHFEAQVIKDLFYLFLKKDVSQSFPFSWGQKDTA